MVDREKEKTTKVKTAIFGSDLRVQLKKYPLSQLGNKIDIVNAGSGYFMPEIGPTNFLDWPSRKRFIFFGPQIYERIFFSLKKASKCVDFSTETGTVYGPDIEQQKKAETNLLAGKIGKDADKGTPWYIWFIIVMQILVFLILWNLGGL